MTSLSEQIERTSRTIFTDSYSMSVGELMNMYVSGEIDIHPEFQRNYRWDLDTKSKLIESLLLGIPIPPIFVFQNSTGIWDVIDGHQRLSTIFECAGIYHDDQNAQLPPLKLSSGKFLTALDGIVWEDEDAAIYQFPIEVRLLIKRAKIDVKILKSNSDKVAKYDLFQRLNSGGQALTPQEIRNCLIIMEDPTFYTKLLLMSQNQDFQNCLPLSENALQTKEDLEYVVRFLVARNCGDDTMPSSLHDFFDASIISLIRTTSFNLDGEMVVFNQVFSFLCNLLGEDSFKRYDKEKCKFLGAVTLSAYESIVPAFSENLNSLSLLDKGQLVEKIKAMHSIPSYKSSSRLRSTDRYKTLVAFGRDYFKPEMLENGN